MSISKLKAVILVAVITFAPRLNATSAVVIIDSNGIVVSSDSKTVFVRGSDFSASGEAEHAKFAILKNRIVVLGIGAEAGKHGTVQYNFLTWMESLQLSLPPNVSVDDVTGIIEKESSAKFSALGIDAALKTGEIHKNVSVEPCEMFAQFVIAGYQGGTPRLYKVQFDIDWNHQAFIGPVRTLLYPDPSGSTPDYRIASFGNLDATNDIANRKSYAYQQAMILCPKAFADIMGGIPPTLDETIAYSRALVQIEKNTNPDTVGGTIRTVKILRIEGASEVVIANRTILPKPKATAKQKHSQ
jgi:hypothetical protein